FFTTETTSKLKRSGLVPANVVSPYPVSPRWTLETGNTSAGCACAVAAHATTPRAAVRRTDPRMCSKDTGHALAPPHVTAVSALRHVSVLCLSGSLSAYHFQQFGFCRIVAGACRTAVQCRKFATTVSGFASVAGRSCWALINVAAGRRSARSSAFDE